MKRLWYVKLIYRHEIDILRNLIGQRYHLSQIVDREWAWGRGGWGGAGRVNVNEND